MVSTPPWAFPRQMTSVAIFPHSMSWLPNSSCGPGWTTLPVFIFSTVRNVVTPEINAVSSLLMLVSIGFVSLSLLTGIRRSG